MPEYGSVGCVCVWAVSGIHWFIEFWICEWNAVTGVEVVVSVMVCWQWGVCVGMHVRVAGKGGLEINWHRGRGKGMVE